MRAFRNLRRRSFLRNEWGASAVELALVSPILLAMLAGIVDCARLVSTKLHLQQAAERTAELKTAGSTASLTDTLLQADAAAAAGVSAANVTVSGWLECDGTRQGSDVTVCPDGQQIARYSTIAIAGSYKPSFAGLLRWATVDGRISVNASASVRTQ
ncbi:MAG TPA: TadE family protein [Sphingomonas sp.]|nr:TadE family protein [Sphingomonas sp.]